MIIINSYNKDSRCFYEFYSTPQGNAALPDFRLTNVSPSLSTYNLSLSGVDSGDSGGPIYITYGNELAASRNTSKRALIRGKVQILEI
jgi:hypothetical protein